MDNQSYQLALLIDRLGRITRSLQYSQNLNPVQWEAIRYIKNANKYSRTPSSIAEFLGTTKGTMSQTLTSLGTKKLIKKVKDENDRRTTYIELTIKGEKILESDPLKQVQDIVSTLDSNKTEDILTAFYKIFNQFQEQLSTKNFGACHHCSYHDTQNTDDKIRSQCGYSNDIIKPIEKNKLCKNFKQKKNEITPNHPDKDLIKKI